jgi:PAS domain-containing protein
MVDTNLNILYISPPAAKIFGHDEDMLENIYSLSILIDDPEIKKDLERLIPNIVQGREPSQLVNGGSYVRTKTRLGDVILHKIAITITIIESEIYAVILFRPIRTLDAFIRAWRNGKLKFIKYNAVLLTFAAAIQGLYPIVQDVLEVFQPAVPPKQRDLSD